MADFVDRAVSEAVRNPEGVADRMTRGCRDMVVSCSPVSLEQAYQSLKSRPGGGSINGCRVNGASNILSRAEEERFFSAYVWARQQLIHMKSTSQSWAEVIVDDWGKVLFMRAVWLRHALWQLNWSLGVGWFAKNKHGCALFVTQDEDDLMSLCHLKLLDCVDLFNPTAGQKFSTYAVNSLNRSIKTQSFREAGRKRNVNQRSIFSDEDRREVCTMTDRVGCSNNSSLSVQDKLDYIRVWGKNLSSDTLQYIEDLIQSRPSSVNVDPSIAFREVKNLMESKLFPQP